MKVGLSTLAKLAKGTLGADEMAELLSSIGIEMSSRQVPASPESFTGLAESASLPGSKIVELRGKMKDGSDLHALMVLHQESNNPS